MIKKVVRKHSINISSARADLAHWLRRPPAERIAAVEYMRRQFYGNPARLQRVARVVKRAQS